MEGRPSDPPSIRRLDEKVVNKIAAGEIIQKPSNAIKELIENSIDAGATDVAIAVKEGGLKFLQVQDNGSGIRMEDMSILCQRHTTSKLVQFSDLRQLQTLGFRGEALASISFVSHLSVITRTKEDHHAWKASYKNGQMEPGSPFPSAGTWGTTVTVDDLFYNIPMRRKGIRSANEEYHELVELVSKYAIYHAGIALSVKRIGHTKTEVRTHPGMSRSDAIRQVYGSSVANGLKYFCAAESPVAGEESHMQDSISLGQFTIEGYLSGPAFSGRKTLFVLFINGRCVESPVLKKCVEAVYGVLLPKNSKPFVFLAISMPSDWLDVNLHPTKKEVAFLYEEELVEQVRSSLESALLENENQRSYAQSIITTIIPSIKQVSEDIASNVRKPAYYRPEKLVRTDALSQTLDDFILSSVSKAKDPSTAENPSFKFQVPQRKKRTRKSLLDSAVLDSDPVSNDNALPASSQSALRVSICDGPRATLLERISSNRHEGLQDILKTPTLVGVVDYQRILIQKGTRLYLLDLPKLSMDLFHQQALRLGGTTDRIMLRPAVSCRSLAYCALEREEILGNWADSEEGGTKSEVAELLTQLLIKNARFLDENFSLEIDDQGNLVALPRLVEGHYAAAHLLPKFVLSLGQDVEWSDKTRCMDTVAWALARLYMVAPPEGGQEPMPSIEDENFLTTVILPAIQAYLIPGKHLSSDGSIVELSRLEHLYRVFERC
eukprot:jgi/Picsp_1/3325/NSC_06164-R1_dna mismatch repair protein homolog